MRHGGQAEERLEGEAEVVTYGSSQLGSDEQMLNKLKLGTIDLSLPSSIMRRDVLVSLRTWCSSWYTD